MAISKGAKRTDGLESADQVKMVVEEITKKSQTVADLFLIGVETQLPLWVDNNSFGGYSIGFKVSDLK